MFTTHPALQSLTQDPLRYMGKMDVGCSPKFSPFVFRNICTHSFIIVPVKTIIIRVPKYHIGWER